MLGDRALSIGSHNMYAPSGAVAGFDYSADGRGGFADRF
jgi:hypothetical protein